MKFELQQDAAGNLIARQKGPALLRYIFGIPLLAWGLLMLYGVFSSFIISLQMKGMGGIGEALVGSLVLLLFTALVLPLGWWLVFSRSWIVLEAASNDIVQCSDWRLGRKQKRTSATVFRAVRVAKEPLDSSSTANHENRSVTYCQQIRLLAREPKKQPSIEIGCLEVNQRPAAIEAGQKVAKVLGLKIEVVNENEVRYSPAREAADSFDIDQD